jgi:hypothetical protein
MILVSKDSRLIARIEALASEFLYSVRVFSGLDEFSEHPGAYRLVLCDIQVPSARMEAALSEYAQVASQVAPDAQVAAVLPNRVDKKILEFGRKNGCDLTLLDEEVHGTSKLEFICTQIIRATFLPVKPSDLSTTRPLGFDLFHLLPQRGKFVKFVFEGDFLTDEKLLRMKEVPEFYVHRSQAGQYAAWVGKEVDNSAKGLAKRCRAQFLALYAGYNELVFLLTDQSGHGSFKEGQDLLRRCRTISGELIGALAAHGSAWEIVNNSVIGEFGSAERSPAVASYAALLALQAGLESIEEMMLASMISELGILFVHPTVTRKIREDRMCDLTAEERMEFENYPLKSLNLVLDRKLQIEEKLRNLVLTMHSRADGKGYPRGGTGGAHKKMTLESQFLGLAYELDRLSLVRLGQPRPNPELVLRRILDEEKKRPARFGLDFTLRVEEAIG